MNPLYWAGHTFYRVLFGLSGGVRVHGREHLPKNGAFLICANHCSLLDPPLIGTSMPMEIAYLAKKQLFKYPVLGSILRVVGAIPIDRSRLGRDTIRIMLRMLKAGRPMLLFPEGTRSRNGQFGEGKIGIGFLARMAGVAVVPTFIQNTWRWPRTWGRHHRIAVHFGAPLPAAWMTKVSRDKDGYQKIVAEIMDRIRILQSDAIGAPTLRVGRTQSRPSDVESKKQIHAPTGKSDRKGGIN